MDTTEVCKKQSKSNDESLKSQIEFKNHLSSFLVSCLSLKKKVSKVQKHIELISEALAKNNLLKAQRLFATFCKSEIYDELMFWGKFKFSKLDDSEIQSCLHDVFLKLWKQISIQKKNPIKNNVRSYLKVSLKNTCLNLIEQKKRKTSLETHLEVKNFNEIKTQNQIENQISWQQSFAFIKEKLTQKQNHLFDLLFQGYNAQEIATELKLNTESVYKSKQRLFKKIRKLF